MAEILPIRRKKPNQSFIQNKPGFFFYKNMYEKGFHLISDLLDEDGEFIYKVWLYQKLLFTYIWRAQESNYTKLLARY